MREILIDTSATDPSHSSKDICYLCGRPLAERETDDDHIPAKQFFPEDIRKMQSVNLIKLPTHKECNHSYQKDEEYFFTALGMTVGEKPVGKMIWKDIAHNLSRPKTNGLLCKMMGEYSDKVGMIYLPPGTKGKTFDSERVWRVIWKIVRGTHAIDNNVVLPDDVPKSFRGIGKEFPDIIKWLLSLDEVKNNLRGRYPGIFAYNVVTPPQCHGWNIWTAAFWDTLVTVVFYQHPVCNCGQCKLVLANCEQS